MRVIIFLLLYNIIYSQNLITNGGFENYSSCPDDFSQIERAIGWKTPSDGTSDYFNACSKNKICSVPKNISGKSYPKEGNAYAGFGLFLDNGVSYEFIQTQLNKKLIATKTYHLEAFIKFARSTNFKFNEISFLFSSDEIKIN